MKIELNDNAVYPVLLCTLMLCIAVVCIVAMLMNCYEVRTYTAHGYTKTTLPGASCVYWVRETK